MGPPKVKGIKDFDLLFCHNHFLTIPNTTACSIRLQMHGKLNFKFCFGILANNVPSDSEKPMVCRVVSIEAIVDNSSVKTVPKIMSFARFQRTKR